ncbi:MAG: ATP synthase F1 subunit delta [Caldilineaceae bacterium]
MSDKQAKLSRYAQAIFQTMVEKWQNELGQVQSAIAADPTLAGQLNDPGRDPAAKVAALDRVLPLGMSNEARNFARYLVQEGDANLLPLVASALSQQTTGRSGPLKAEVTSAFELSPEEQQSIRAKLVQEHGDGLIFTFSVDPSLMGGLRVRVGDTLIDTSVASRLALLRESLASVVR